jgi:hypothetical protein
VWPFLKFIDVVFDIHQQPVWEDLINKPNGDTSRTNGVQVNATGLTEGGLSAYPAGMASSPPAPRQHSVIIAVESPSSKSRAASERDMTTVREKMVLPIISP